MGWIIALVIIIAVVALDVAMLQGTTAEETPTASYRRSSQLFTPTEQSFLRVLDQAVGDSARILGKVRVADVVVPGVGLSRSDRNETQHRLFHARFDFLLCKQDDLSVICAIVLDDGARRLKGQWHPSAFLIEVCDVAGVPLIHVPARFTTAIDEVRKLLAPHLGPYGSADQAET